MLGKVENRPKGLPFCVFDNLPKLKKTEKLEEKNFIFFQFLAFRLSVRKISFTGLEGDHYGNFWSCGTDELIHDLKTTYGFFAAVQRFSEKKISFDQRVPPSL